MHPIVFNFAGHLLFEPCIFAFRTDTPNSTFTTILKAWTVFVLTLVLGTSASIRFPRFVVDTYHWNSGVHWKFFLSIMILLLHLFEVLDPSFLWELDMPLRNLWLLVIEMTKILLFCSRAMMFSVCEEVFSGCVFFLHQSVWLKLQIS